MRLLKTLGILFFFLYYYFVIGLTTILNAVVWFWKAITRGDPEKHKVNPYEATHSLVFAHICKIYLMQNKSSQRAVIY